MADQSFAAIEQISMPSTKAEENGPKKGQTAERVPAPRPVKKSPAARKKTVSAKQSVDAKMSPGRRAVARNVPVEKLDAGGKVEVKKSEDVKAATSMPKPSVASKPAPLPVPGDKEAIKKNLGKKV